MPTHFQNESAAEKQKNAMYYGSTLSLSFMGEILPKQMCGPFSPSSC